MIDFGWLEAIEAAKYLESKGYLCKGCSKKAAFENMFGLWCRKCAERRYGSTNCLSDTVNEHDFCSSLYARWQEFLESNNPREPECSTGGTDPANSEGDSGPPELHPEYVGKVVCIMCKKWPCRCGVIGVHGRGTKASRTAVAKLLGGGLTGE